MHMMLTISQEIHPKFFLTVPVGDRWVAMQSTGVLDKKGREIYEGDILKFVGDKKIRPRKGRKHIWVVVWDQKSLHFYRKNEDLSHSLVENHFSSTHEIVGNIYENPGLV